MHGWPIDVADAGLKAPRHPEGPIDVTAKNRRREPIGSIIGDAHGLILALGAHHHRHGPKGLFVINAHLGGDMVEHVRVDQRAVDAATR